MPTKPSTSATNTHAINHNFIDAIGNTALIRLRAVSEMTGCEIYGKAEFMNPGGSVKDLSLIHISEPTRPY